MTYEHLRQFPAALKTYDRLLDILPNDPDVIASEAWIYQAQGNLERAGKLLVSIDPAARSLSAFVTKMEQLVLERHLDEAIRLTRSQLTESRDLAERERLSVQLALIGIQKCDGDIAGARASAQQLLTVVEPASKKTPDDAFFASALSGIYATLGDKDAAIREAERAITLVPTDKDAVEGPDFEERLAAVAAEIGDKNRAIAMLQRLLEIPGSLTPAILRLEPMWDPLREDPRFQKLCEEKH